MCYSATVLLWPRKYAVAQLVEALRYKPECHWFDSGRTVALESTQPLTEMSTRDYPRVGKGCRYVELTTLLPSCTEFLEILAAPNFLNLNAPIQSYTGVALPLLLLWSYFCATWFGRLKVWGKKVSVFYVGNGRDNIAIILLVTGKKYILYYNEVYWFSVKYEYY